MIKSKALEVKEMVKRTVSFLFLIILLILIGYTLAQAYKNKPISIIKSLSLEDKISVSFSDLVYKINLFAVLPIGEAEIKISENLYKKKNAYYLEANAYSSGLLSRFFKASARADSYVDKNKLHSLRFTEALIMPDKPKLEKEILYDQENNVMELNGVKRQILPDTQDPLSAIFYIRKHPMVLNTVFDININTNQKNYRLFAKVIRKEEYVIGNNKTGVLVLNGDIRRRDKNNPYHRSSFTLWLLDNSEKTPILIKIVASGIPITAILICLK